MKKALLISGGSSSEEVIEKYREDSYIISVDSGAGILRKMNIEPDLFIGDFDSIDDISRKMLDSESSEVIKVKAEKDETDTELAVIAALERGFKEIVMVGATGTRLDHTLGNMSLLSRIEKAGAKGLIADGHNEIRFTSGYLKVKKDPGFKYLSIIPFGGNASGISIKGTKYEADSIEIESDSVIGVSNEITADFAEIEVKEGKLLVIKSKD